MNSTPHPRMLELPKRSLPRQIESESCLYNNNFNVSDKKCLWCEWGNKCSLIYKMDKLQGKRPDFTLILEVFHSMYQHVYAKKHDPQCCSCEECRWLCDVSFNLDINFID